MALLSQALSGTRTPDPLLTMEGHMGKHGVFRHSRQPFPPSEMPHLAPSGGPKTGASAGAKIRGATPKSRSLFPQ